MRKRAAIVLVIIPVTILVSSFILWAWGTAVFLRIIIVATIALMIARSLFYLGFSPIEWLNSDNFDILASKMGIVLSQEKRYGKSSLSYLAAYADGLRRCVIFNSRLFDKLSPDDRILIISHEFAHLKARHPQVKIVAAVVMLTLSMMTTFLYLPIFALIPFFLTFVVLGCLNRSQEYAADIEGARFTGVEKMVAFINRLYPEKEKSIDFLSHPSPARRIHHLLESKGLEPKPLK